MWHPAGSSPFPSRTTSRFAAKSRSLTRRRNASSSRSPPPCPVGEREAPPLPLGKGPRADAGDAHDVVEPWQRVVEHLAIEEHPRAESLSLRRRAHVSRRREMGEEGIHVQ